MFNNCVCCVSVSMCRDMERVSREWKRVSRDVCKWTQDATFSHKSMHKKSQVLLLSVEEKFVCVTFSHRSLFFVSRAVCMWASQSHEFVSLCK